MEATILPNTAQIISHDRPLPNPTKPRTQPREDGRSLHFPRNNVTLKTQSSETLMFPSHISKIKSWANAQKHTLFQKL